jgi:sugar transferase (PEP-CTERM/EpsH1 system associated)
MSSGFFYSPELATRAVQLLRQVQYDLIFVYCSSMEQFVPSPAPVPIVVDFVDADSAKWQQYARMCRGPRSWLFRREACAVANLERSLARRASLCLVTTPHDAKELVRSGACESRVEVLPNGVHIPEDLLGTEEMVPRELKPYVVFVGTMDYRPNADAAEHFALEIFPSLRERYPDLHFLIVGRNPNSRVRHLQAIRGVKVIGAVPNVYPYFRQAQAAVAPFRISQGFHNKIIESLAVGTPVVAAARAAAGIGLSAEQGLYIANSPDEFVETVDVLLSSSSLRQHVRQSAASLRRALSWDVRLRRLGDLLANVSAATPIPGALHQHGS